MTTATGHTATTPFGARLRSWRLARGLSQLVLASTAGTTSRHVSFLETGRSRPSSDVVVRRCAALDMPLRDRNELLRAAGLAAVYPEQPVSAEELRPFRAVLDRLLEAHQPYPGLVCDRHWTVVACNKACASLFGDELLGE